jgi:predicted nucleic acid-binding protein
MALSEALADTSVFIANESGRPLRVGAIPDRLAVSVITIGELRAGVLGASDSVTRERRLVTLERALTLEPVPVDQAVAAAWARLRIALREAGKRMSVNDSWIAATAMALNLPVLTQDADYANVPGLDIIVV